MSGLRWQCAWCGMQRELGTLSTDSPVTHGICERCLDRVMHGAAGAAIAPNHDRECVRISLMKGDV